MPCTTIRKPRVDRLKKYLLPKYTSNNKDLSKADEKKTNDKTVKQKLTNKPDNQKENLVKSQVPRRINTDKVGKPVKKYPGLKSDILKFTSSYFGKDTRENSRYNLRKTKRIDYNDQAF